METKETIIYLYFEKHYKQKQIAQMLNVSNSYVSQILKNTDKTLEKERRHQESLDKKKKYNNLYWETYERPKHCNNAIEEYDALQNQIAKDNYNLSTKSELSDQQMVYSNLSAYHADKNGNLKLDPLLNATYDMPKSLNRNNTKLPTQKYKHKICMER